MTRVPAQTRKLVRERAGGRCEYCCKPEKYAVYFFHVDHIIPILRHGGTQEIDNLAWACFECNTEKAGDIASYDFEAANLLTPLYNPRMDSWNTHFEFKDAEVFGKTPVGRVTVRVLNMNHPKQVETRRYLMSAGLW